MRQTFKSFLVLFFKKGLLAFAPRRLTIQGEPDWHKTKFQMHARDGRDQVARVAGACGWEAFERPTPFYFSRTVAEAGGGLVIDVGSNTGFYSLLALAVSDRVRVAAYEPMASVRAMLEANLKLNKVGGRVRVYGDAVSDRDGEGALYIPDAGHGLVETSASLVAGFKDDVAGQEWVATRRLDTMHVGGERVAVLKIDAESHDLAVLRGAEAVLRRDRPVVFLEVLLGADEAGLTELMLRCGYRDLVLFEEGASAPGARVVHETRAWNHMWVPEEGLLF